MGSTNDGKHGLLGWLMACLVTFCGPLYAASPDGSAQTGVSIPTLGIRVAGLSNEALDRRRIPLGVAVVDLTAGGPSAAAGIEEGDVIYQLNGLPTYSVDRLHWLIEHSAAAVNYRVSVIRNGEHLEFAVPTGGPPDR
jgi:putative serine protease PepD